MPRHSYSIREFVQIVKMGKITSGVSEAGVRNYTEGSSFPKSWEGFAWKKLTANKLEFKNSIGIYFKPGNPGTWCNTPGKAEWSFTELEFEVHDENQKPLSEAELAKYILEQRKELAKFDETIFVEASMRKMAKEQKDKC